MNYQTLPNTQARAAVDLVCRRLNLGGAPDTTFPRSVGSILPERPSLRDIAHICVENATAAERACWHQGLDMAARAMTTSDFSSILADVSSKQLQAAYATRPASFVKWASSGSVPNFKSMSVCRVTAPGLLPEVREADEYKHLTLEDGAETIRLRTFGGLLSVSRQTIINDDLDALVDLNRLLAQSAALTQATIATASLTGSDALSDGTPVFDASRGNLLSGLTSALDADSLTLGVATMRRFTDSNGQPLAIEPKFLIVPPELERIACQLCYSDSDPSSNNAGTLNIFKRNGLEVIVEPMLTSAKVWYLLADPAIVPVYRFYTLDGAGLAPFVESRNGFSNDKLELKTRIDFTAAAIGHFAVKSAGE